LSVLCSVLGSVQRALGSVQRALGSVQRALGSVLGSKRRMPRLI